MPLKNLSLKELIIFRILTAQNGLYGLEIVQHSKGSIKKGTVYTTLKRMQKMGYVTSEKEIKEIPVPGIHRRLYFVTIGGTSAYNAQIKVLMGPALISPPA